MVKSRLNSCGARDVAQAAFGVVQFNQDLDPKLVFAGIFAAFAATCEELRINPFDAHALGRRYINAGDIAREVSALRDFIKYQAKREMPKPPAAVKPFDMKEYTSNGNARVL